MRRWSSSADAGLGTRRERQKRGWPEEERAVLVTGAAQGRPRLIDPERDQPRLRPCLNYWDVTIFLAFSYLRPASFRERGEQKSQCPHRCSRPTPQNGQASS